MSNTNYTILIQQSATANPIVIEAPIPDSFAFDVGASYETPLPQGLTDNKIINMTSAAIGTRLAVQAMSAQLWMGNTATELAVEVEFHTETDPVQDVRTPMVNLLKLTMPSINPSTGLLTSPGPSFDASFIPQVLGGIADSAGSALGAVGSIGTAGLNFVKSAFNSIAPSSLQIGSLNNTSTQTNDGANNTTPAAITQNPSLGSAAFWNTKIKNKISIRVGNYLYFDSVVITRVGITAASNFDAQTGLPHHARVAIAFKPLFMLVQSDLDTLFINPNAGSLGGGTPGTNNYGFAMPSSVPPANSFASSVRSNSGNGFNSFGFNL